MGKYHSSDNIVHTWICTYYISNIHSMESILPYLIMTFLITMFVFNISKCLRYFIYTISQSLHNLTKHF